MAQVIANLLIESFNQEPIQEQAHEIMRQDHVSMGIRLTIKYLHQMRNGVNAPLVLWEEELPVTVRACIIEFDRFLVPVPDVARVSILDMLLSMNIIHLQDCENIAQRIVDGVVELAARARERGETKLLVIARIIVSIIQEYNDQGDDMDRVLQESMDGSQMGGFGAVPASTSFIDALNRARFEETTDGKAACVICMEEFCGGTEIVEIPCKHIFHGDCIVRWLERSRLCPLCRFAMPA